MKIYRVENGIILVGKAWEVRAKLKEYSKYYGTVQEWLEDKKTFTEPTLPIKR
ncbi:Z-ring formation inhibitor MciZ [Metabacillus malikii]|uniref:Z-ring formation inhibitor MciZ n=1 Tax=Metabacillus malikii TaxID=1504265 RepID=A0ABT9ZHX7_9BACI|nr:Z-ring formation inhibitor MciZ [Metabacillus malikii]MDQ0231869.1 hypothetical protein [Metabacillus malikii]